VLYRNDGNIGTDYMAQALAASGYGVTTISGDLSTFDLNDFDIVVYANQTFGMSGYDIDQINNYVSAGGHTIIHDFGGFGGFDLLQVDPGISNPESVTVGPMFGAGVVSPLAVVNPGWGGFSMGMIANAQGVVAATFENGEAAIVTSLYGQMIFNSFLTDTVASPQLYLNELHSFTQVAQTPIPAALPLFATALAGFGFMARRRKQLDADAA